MSFFLGISNWIKKHERHMTSVALLLGFIIDNFTLTRIDQLFDTLILLAYLTVAGLGIIFVHLYEAKRIRGWFIEKLIPWLPLMIQFAFGGLFSGYFIFYSRSASLAESWIFLVILLGLLLGNEAFKTRYLRFGFQIGIFFVALFSFMIFYIPIVVKSLSAWTFILSGIVSLFIIFLFIKLLKKISPNRIDKGKWQLRFIIGIIYIGINVMYFTNVIPPIPLSLKDSGVFHYVENIKNGDYILLQEKRAWYEFYKKFRPTIHLTSESPVYFYNAIFSPTDLNVNILHSWQYYDETRDTWVESFRFKYKIFGGRDGGYRGYSIKENIWPAKWRVDVMTEREQLLGRHIFKVVDTINPPVLETIIK